MIKISDTEYFSNDKTIRFLNMDCNVFMAGCKENEFDLNHSDPPYGMKQSSSNGSGKLKHRALNKMSTKWDIAPNYEVIKNMLQKINFLNFVLF
jgi:DNA modification methylase